MKRLHTLGVQLGLGVEKLESYISLQCFHIILLIFHSFQYIETLPTAKEHAFTTQFFLFLIYDYEK
jgi:hypothetical protein